MDVAYNAAETGLASTCTYRSCVVMVKMRVYLGDNLLSCPTFRSFVFFRFIHGRIPRRSFGIGGIEVVEERRILRKR